MDLEKFFELVLKNPDNINILYSNINGEEKLIVNGEDLTKEEYDEIKEKIKNYKKNLKYLDEWIWNIVIDEAKNRNFNLYEMDRILNLNSYTEEEALQAQNTIDIMSDLIKEVINQEIKSLHSLTERF